MSVRIFALAVDALALGVIAATATLVPIGRTDLMRVAILACGSVIYVEATRGIERMRQVVTEGRPYVNLKWMWAFTGVLILPPPLTASLIVFTYAHAWLRASRRIPAYKTVFTVSAVMLAGATSGTFLYVISGADYASLPTGPRGLAAVGAAGLAFLFVTDALVAFAVLLSAPNQPGSQALSSRNDLLIEAGSLGMGFAMAAVIEDGPWLVVVLLLTVLALHRALLVDQYQSAANTDPKTGLANAGFWHKKATDELALAQRDGVPLGVLMIDMDRFKAFNDDYGHLAGDQALKAVAAALQSETRDYDLVGRFGGEEFAVLLPGTNAFEIGHTAERIRRRVAELSITIDTHTGPRTVDTLTCSIGAATYPESAADIDKLVLAADTATYKAKTGGRNQVQLADSLAIPDPDSA
jgi:diguanylate cyclase (GGDEF)-like protein